MLGDADGNGVINFLDFLVSIRYYTDVTDELPAKDLDGDGVAGRKDYLIFAREFAGVGEDYLPDLFAIDELLAFADVSGDGEVGATDYLIAYATLYEKEISECLTNGISLKTSMQAADINGDGEITEADKDIGIDYALNGNNDYDIGEMVDNTSTCNVAVDNSIVTAQYAYNPSGLRNAKTVGGSTKYFVYNGSQIIYEYDDLGEGTIYYYGLNRTHNSNGEIYVYNAHGDTVQLVNDGVVTVTYTYDAFGNLTSQTGESDNPFKYCGEYYDEETGTYYLRARYYNPANGRFTQQDAWAFIDTRDPLSLNLYTYCCNNPIMYFDCSGHVFGWIALLAVGVISIALTGCDSSSSYVGDNIPVYNPVIWNDKNYIRNTNCYAYAFDMLINPITGEKFPERGMQPGMLSGQYPSEAIAIIDNIIEKRGILTINTNEEYIAALEMLSYNEIVSGTDAGNKKLIDMITADANAAGIDFLSYNDKLTGGYRVALVVNPNIDYHWYRDNGDGTWSHKPGTTEAINLETIANPDGSFSYGDIITNPAIAAPKAGYTVFVGYYYVKPKK